MVLRSNRNRSATRVRGSKSETGVGVMTPSIDDRNASRHTGTPLPYLRLSEGLREYRQATEGLGLRFRFPSHLTCRSGAQPSPHEKILHFLAAGRAAGLPRSWGERTALWLAGQVSRVWREAHERDEWLEHRELEAENDCNVCELTYRLHPTPENRQRLIDGLRREAARELARANALEAE